MKFSFGIAVVALLTALTSFDPVDAAAPPVDVFRTPGASGICKEADIKANGTQIRAGFCSSQLQGEIPSADKMVSCLITFPRNGDFLEANKNFTIKIKIINLVTGFFTDPITDYYDQPQQLDKETGFIKGHSHVTIQQLSPNDEVPDPAIFAFFKGLNDAAVNGVFSQVVGTAKLPGLPAGDYRLCTMSSSFAHQPVIMPVAQRGSQDDCVRFTVKKFGGKRKKSS